MAIMMIAKMTIGMIAKRIHQYQRILQGLLQRFAISPLVRWKQGKKDRWKTSKPLRNIMKT